MENFTGAEAGAVILLVLLFVFIAVMIALNSGSGETEDDNNIEEITNDKGEIIQVKRKKYKSSNGEALRIISAVFLILSVLGALGIFIAYEAFNMFTFSTAVSMILTGVIFRYIAVTIAESADNAGQAKINTEEILKKFEENKN